MTLLSPTIKLCGVCRMPNFMIETASTSFFGTPDLDARRGNVQFMFMQKCWRCHYCTIDISKASDQRRHFVRSEDYRWHAKRPDLPQSACKFHCHSLILENEQSFIAAGLTALSAAHACDDAKHDLGAKYCRERAIDMLKPTIGTGKLILDSIVGDYLLMVDIHRRIHQFDVALDYLNKIEHGTELELRIKEFQELLINNRDSKQYNVKHIPSAVD